MRDLQASAVPLGTPTSSKRAKTVSDFFKKSRRKRALTSTGGNFCRMQVAVDHLFFADIGGNDYQNTFAEVVTTFNFVQDIYQRTDFDGDGTEDFITPSIEEFEILTPNNSNQSYLFGASTIPVNDFLDLWSQIDHTAFCLALLFTNRDFADGVLGLAWVAQPPGGNRGGVCEGRVQLNVGERSLNTAIVTFTNFGRQQPRAVSVVTVAHELGHNFGSPVSVCTCTYTPTYTYMCTCTLFIHVHVPVHTCTCTYIVYTYRCQGCPQEFQKGTHSEHSLKSVALKATGTTCMSIRA